MSIKEQLNNLAKKFQKGGQIDTLDTTKEWWERYVNSPKYRERLGKEFPKYSESEIDSELSARKLNLDRTYPIIGGQEFQDPGLQGFARPPEEDQRRNPSIKSKIKNFVEDNIAPSSRPVHLRSGEDTSTYTHEISHSVDEGGRRIPDSTVGNLVKRVRGVEPVDVYKEDDNALYYNHVQNPNTRKALEDMNNFYPLDEMDEQQSQIYPNIKWKLGDDPQEYSPKFGYRSNPTEMIARLQSLRKDMYDQGVHDSAKEDISAETLSKYIDGIYESEEEIPPHLLDLLNESKQGNDNSPKNTVIENLQWMMNNIAKNTKKEENQMQYSQKGGTIKGELDVLLQKFQNGGQTRCIPCEQKAMMQKGGIYDELSFKDAFKKAMSEGKEGENFEWRGNQYKREYTSPQKPSPVAKQNMDDLSFGEAFRREIANKNGRESFKWRGKDYNLSYKDDEKMVPTVNLPQKEKPVQQRAQNEIEEVVLKKSPNLSNPFLNQKDQTHIFKPVEMDRKYYSTALDLEAIRKSNDSIRENEKVKNVVISRDNKGQEIVDKNGNLEYIIKSPDYVKEFNNHIQNINKNLQEPNIQEEAPIGLSKLNFLQQNYNGDTAFVQNNGVWERVTNNVQGDINNILTYEKERGKGNNFVIIDKKNQKLSIYDKQGRKLEDTEVMLGKNKWDSVSMLYAGKEGKHADYGTGNASTGAGIFSIGDIEEEAQGYLTKEPLYMLRDEEGNYTNQAMHAPASQGRADRLNNKDMDDNRITFGCVAGKCGFMKNIHRKRLLNQGDRVYITPEEEGNRMEYENGELKTIMSQENIDEYAEYGDGYGTTRKGRGNYSKEKKPKTVLDIFLNKYPHKISRK